MTSPRTLAAAALALALGCAAGAQDVKESAEQAAAPAPAKDAAALAKQAAEEAAAAAEKAKAAAAEAARKLIEATATPDAPFRAQKPPAAEGGADFKAPVPAVKRLRGGVRLLVVENHALPLVSIDLAVPAGTDAEPEGKAGLADFVAAMLREGTKQRTGVELAEALGDLAVVLGSSAGPETMHLTLSTLKETLPEALDLLAEVLLQPAFRPEDVERVRSLRLTALLQKQASPGALAQDAANRLLYGEKHPRGQPDGGTAESVAAITVADLQKFHETWYRPNQAAIGVSGDVTPAEVQKLLAPRLAAWKAKAPPRLKLPPAPVLARQVVLVDKPGASQSQVWVVGRLVPAKDPDAVPLRVANNVLGGLFGSRLNMNLRETKSWSYGVRSRLDLERSAGALVASGGIQAPFTADAVAEYYKEIEEFSSGELREGELARAREAVVRALPAQLETNAAVASAMARLALQGLPADWYKQLPARVAKVDAKELARVVQKHLVPARMPAVVVGPKALSEEKLKSLKLGPLEVREAPALPAAPK